MTMNKLDDLTKSYILLNYVKQAAMGLKHKFCNPTTVTVECVFCGAKKNKGTIYLANTNRLCYICWKPDCPCSKAILASKWLKQVDPQLYSAYKNEVNEKENGSQTDADAIKKQIEEQNKKLLEQQQREIAIKKSQDDESTKFFRKIEDGSELSKLAIDYCKSRMIPEEIWKRFYIAHEGKYHDRLIIPFFNKAGKIEYFQGRSLIGVDPKYMNRCSTETFLYNHDFVDKNKPVFVLEGPIDSMFIENAVATCGAGSSASLDTELKKYEQVFYIMDNDAAGNKKAGQLVREHKQVFLWTKFLNDIGIGFNDVKDINDVIVKLNKTDKFTYADLQNYFTNITDEFMCYL